MADDTQVDEPDSTPAVVARQQPWTRVRFWVAAVLVVLFLASFPASPGGSILTVLIVLAAYWKWDDIIAWNRRRRLPGSESGRSAAAEAPERASAGGSSYVGKTLVGGEETLYMAHLSKWIFLPGVVLSLILIGLLLLVIEWMQYTTTEMVITNRRVIAKRGWVSRRTVELRLSKVESAQVHQGVLGRMLGYGSVELIGTGGSRETFGFIANPLGFRRALSEAQDRHEDRTRV